MLSNLAYLSKLNFPIATLKKTADIKDNKDYIFYEGQAILKDTDLFSTFNLNAPFLPPTYSYIYYLEYLLANPSAVSGKLIIDSHLDIYIPAKIVKVTYRTEEFIQRLGNFIKIKYYKPLLPEIVKRSAKYPIIASIKSHKFLVDWSDKKLREYETFI